MTALPARPSVAGGTSRDLHFFSAYQNVVVKPTKRILPIVLGQRHGPMRTSQPFPRNFVRKVLQDGGSMLRQR